MISSLAYLFSQQMVCRPITAPDNTRKFRIWRFSRYLLASLKYTGIILIQYTRRHRTDLHISNWPYPTPFAVTRHWRSSQPLHRPLPRYKMHLQRRGYHSPIPRHDSLLLKGYPSNFCILFSTHSKFRIDVARFLFAHMKLWGMSWELNLANQAAHPVPSNHFNTTFPNLNNQL